LSVTHPGYPLINYGAKPGQTDGLTLALAEAQPLRDLVVRVPRGAVITGRLTDETGRPVDDALVLFVEDRRGRAELPGGSSAWPRRATTDDRGIYRAYGLGAGTYLAVVPTPPLPLRGPFLDALRAAGAGPGSRTDLTAARPMTNFAPVYYPGVVDPGAATPITVAAGDERGGVDMTLALAVTSRVSGRLTRADGSVPAGAQVHALPMGIEVDLGPLSMLIGSPRASVGADGTFTFSSVSPGRYTLEARAGGGGAPASGEDSARQTPTLWASERVVVSGADISGVALVLQPGMTISGRVLFDGTTPAPDPATLVRGSMRLTLPPAPGPAMRPASGAIRADGSFSIDGIAPGTYGMAGYVPGATGNRPIWTVRSVRARGRDLLDQPIQIQPGIDLEDVVVTFTDRATGISGLLLDQLGRPAPELFVLVFSTDRSHWYRGSRRVLVPTRPGSDGRYEINGLPPGEYYLAVIRDFHATDYATPEFLDRIAPGAIRVTLGEGEQKVQDVKLGI
jgi:hypothetical protein